eukprot:COSAG02_NODE_7210_length_3118_cov_1.879762_1_plen_200_part_00
MRFPAFAVATQAHKCRTLPPALLPRSRQPAVPGCSSHSSLLTPLRLHRSNAGLGGFRVPVALPRRSLAAPPSILCKECGWELSPNHSAAPHGAVLAQPRRRHVSDPAMPAACVHSACLMPGRVVVRRRTDTTAGRNRCGHYVIPREPEIRVLKSLDSRFSPIQNSPVTARRFGRDSESSDGTPMDSYHILKIVIICNTV